LIGVEDLNWHPYAAMPVTIKEQGCKSFWAFGRQNGSVQVLLTLDRSGFICGESIDVTAEIVNNSKKKLKSSVVQLRQGVLYKTSGGRTKETFQFVADLQRGSIQPSSIYQWEREQLTVPPIPPSFLRGSENISLKYELIFTVPDANITLVVPIIIGTLPYHPENMRQIMKALPWHTQEQEAIYGQRPIVCPQQAPQMPSHQPQMHEMSMRQRYNNHQDANDENFEPPTDYNTEEEEDDDENNNYNYRNNLKSTEYERQDQQNQKIPSKGTKNQMQSNKLRDHRKQEEVYNSKNNCYYYDDQPRFLRIEEID